LIWLSQMSNAQSKIEREKDQQITSREQIKMKKLSNFRKSQYSTNSYDLELVEKISSEIKSRKSSSLSELSFTVIAAVNNNLEYVNSYEYNLFDLDSVIEKKTLHFLSYEIFNNNNYFDELLDENKFKNFINEISVGYDRKVKYHNDLHAGDVMQTTNMMIVKGDLIHVKDLLFYIESESKRCRCNCFASSSNLPRLQTQRLQQSLPYKR
jgi:hypothetical protein